VTAPPGARSTSGCGSHPSSTTRVGPRGRAGRGRHAPVAAARDRRPARVVRRGRRPDAGVHPQPQGRGGDRAGARERLGDATDPDGVRLADTVAAYRAGYLAEERRDLETRLRDGRAAGGGGDLRVGARDRRRRPRRRRPGRLARHQRVVLAAARPGRTGRRRRGRGARRAGGSARPLPRRPPGGAARPSAEDAIVDPANPYLLAPHLRCACQEAPLTDEEAATWFGGTAPAALAADVAAGRLRRRADQHFWISRRRAAGEVDLRSAGGATVRIVDAETGRADRRRRRGSCPPPGPRGGGLPPPGPTVRGPARSTSTGTWRWPRRRRGSPTPPGRARTPTSGCSTSPRVRGLGRGHRPLGRVEVTTQVTGYEVLRLGSDEVLDRIELDLPPIELVTVAVWYVIPEDDLDAAGVAPRRCPARCTPPSTPPSACCRCWRCATAGTSGAVDGAAPRHGPPTVFVYDGYPGGAGLAERSFRRFAEHLPAPARPSRPAVADRVPVVRAVPEVRQRQRPARQGRRGARPRPAAGARPASAGTPTTRPSTPRPGRRPCRPSGPGRRRRRRPPPPRARAHLRT
jgi:DEAD/DEAH box helicase domain-containing protein